jgi:hypothetical protein
MVEFSPWRLYASSVASFHELSRIYCAHSSAEWKIFVKTMFVTKNPQKKKMKNETGHERIQLHHPHFAHFAPGANKHHILK